VQSIALPTRCAVAREIVLLIACTAFGACVPLIEVDGEPDELVILGFAGDEGTPYRRCDLVWSTETLRAEDATRIEAPSLRLVFVGVPSGTTELRLALAAEPALEPSWIGAPSRDDAAQVESRTDLLLPRLATGPTTAIISCPTACGDGDIDGPFEGCDDGNVTAGDGCSEECDDEAGWNCSPFGCFSRCGDGIKVHTEQCDDGNLIARDGCDGGCRLEPG